MKPVSKSVTVWVNGASVFLVTTLGVVEAMLPTARDMLPGSTYFWLALGLGLVNAWLRLYRTSEPLATNKDAQS